MIDDVLVAKGLGGLAGLALAGRFALSWWRKQDFGDKLSSERDTFIGQLKSEIAELRAVNNELRRIHDEHLKLIAELQKNNALLLLLLKQKGVTDEEIAAAGVKR